MKNDFYNVSFGQTDVISEKTKQNKNQKDIWEIVRKFTPKRKSHCNIISLDNRFQNF